MIENLKKNQSSDWVDYAKGIGIILVVMGHVNRGLDSAGIHLSNAFFKSFDGIIYSFHMPLFFFLSGLFFISSIEKSGKIEFVKKKIGTIAYPYVIWSIIQGGITVLLSNLTNKKTDMMSVFLFPTHPIGQFWFLYALFMIFMVSCIIYNKKYFTTLLPILTIISFLLYIYSLNIGNSLHVDYITNNIVFFFSGCIFNTLKIDTTNKKNVIAITITSALSFILIQYKSHFIDEMLHDDKGFSTFVVAITSIFFIYALSLSLSLVKFNLLKVIGAGSMIIFLAHIICGSGTRIMLTKIFGIENWYIHIVVGTIAGIVMPLLFFRVIKGLNLMFLVTYPTKKHIIQENQTT